MTLGLREVHLFTPATQGIVRSSFRQLTSMTAKEGVRISAIAAMSLRSCQEIQGRTIPVLCENPERLAQDPNLTVPAIANQPLPSFCQDLPQPLRRLPPRYPAPRPVQQNLRARARRHIVPCLLYTSDAAD